MKILHIQQITKEDILKLLDIQVSGNTEYYIQVTKTRKGTKPFRNHGGRLFTKDELESFKNKYLSIYKLKVLPDFILIN
jgi:hypothetical protein